MRTAKVEKLTLAKFRPFGTYADMLTPPGEKLGKLPVEFYRDMVQLDLGDSIASFSICRVMPRPEVIDISEYHTACGEAILPLHADILIHVAPATPPDDPPPAKRIRVFMVPRGTLVVLRPGVWHHAPFVVEGDVANVLIVLPERTYANDCEVVPLDPSDQVRVQS